MLFDDQPQYKTRGQFYWTLVQAWLRRMAQNSDDEPSRLVEPPGCF